jgi:hypothetical protein
MAASTSPSGPMSAAGMGSRRGSDGGLEGGDGGVGEGVLVGGKVERGIRPALRAACAALRPGSDTTATGIAASLSTSGRYEPRRPDKPQAPQKPASPGGYP